MRDPQSSDMRYIRYMTSAHPLAAIPIRSFRLIIFFWLFSSQSWRKV